MRSRNYHSQMHASDFKEHNLKKQDVRLATTSQLSPYTPGSKCTTQRKHDLTRAVQRRSTTRKAALVLGQVTVPLCLQCRASDTAAATAPLRACPTRAATPRTQRCIRGRPLRAAPPPLLEGGEGPRRHRRRPSPLCPALPPLPEEGEVPCRRRRRASQLCLAPPPEGGEGPDTIDASRASSGGILWQRRG